MKGLERLLQATARVDPPEEEGAPPDRAVLEESFQERVLSTGRGVAGYQLLILAGCRNGWMVHHAAALLPALKQILVLESDPRSLRGLVLSLAATPTVADLVEVCDNLLQEVPSREAVYGAVVGFLVKQDCPMSAVLVWVDPAMVESPRHQMVRVVVRDLFSGMSGGLLIEAGPAPAIFSPSFVRLWARYLEKHGSLFHAAKCYQTLLRLGALRPGELLYLLKLWMQLQCMAMVGRLLEEMVVDPGERQHIQKQLDAVDPMVQRHEEACFQENMRFLAAKWPELARRVAQHAADPGLFCAVAQNILWRYHLLDQPPSIALGDYPIFFRMENGHIHELNRPMDDLFEMISRLIRNPSGGHMAGSGLHNFGHLLNFIWNPRPSSMPNCQPCLYLVEPDLAVLKGVMCHVPLQELFGWGQLFLYGGEDGKKELFQMFEQDVSRTIPGTMIGFSPEDLEQWNSIHRQRKIENQTNVLKIACGYPDDFYRQLRAVLASGQRPCRILFITSIFTTVLQYAVRDLAEAFRDLGHETLVLCEKDAGESMDSLKVARGVLAFKPDLMFCIDHLRAEMSGSVPPQIPFLCWIQDLMPHLTDPALIRTLGPLDLNYCYTGWREFLLAQGYGHMEPLSFAVNTSQFFPMPELGEPDDQVAFITHLHPVQASKKLPGLFDWLDACHPVPFQGLDAMIPQIVEESRRHFDVPLDEAENRELFSTVALYLRRQHRILFVDLLTAAGIDCALYGEGWDEIDRFRPMSRGVVANGRPLAEVYQRHKVVLHLGINLHFRVMEALACGGFVIILQHPEDMALGGVQQVLDVGRDIMLFTSEAEMVALVRKAFTDKHWRRQVADRGRGRVLSSCSYRERAKFILDSLRDHLQSLG